MVRITELPSVLCSKEEGGILETRNALLLPNILRSGEAPKVGQGAFIMVTSSDRHARETLRRCLESNASGTAFLVYRPHHMIGVETAASIMVAGLARLPTGSSSVLPRLDVRIEATRDFKKGETVASPGKLAYDRGLRATLMPATPLGDDNPLPAYMSEANRLTVDVPKGSVITRRMVRAPEDSVMWSLRQRQDELFLTGSPARPETKGRS